MLAAPAIIDWSMTIASGLGNIIIPRWWPNKKKKGHLSPRSEISIVFKVQEGVIFAHF
jgi:hypothetical protein